MISVETDGAAEAGSGKEQKTVNRNQEKTKSLKNTPAGKLSWSFLRLFHMCADYQQVAFLTRHKKRCTVAVLQSDSS